MTLKACKCWLCEHYNLGLGGTSFYFSDFAEYYAPCGICATRNIEKEDPGMLWPDEVAWILRDRFICWECRRSMLYHVKHVFYLCWDKSPSDYLKLALLSFIRVQIKQYILGHSYWWNFKIPFGDVHERDDEGITEKGAYLFEIKLKPRIKVREKI